jgi:hypothetical protein
MESTYILSQRTLLLHDSPKSIDFHIRSGDYFLYLATLVGAMEEALEQCSANGVDSERERAMARSLRHDLRYVHANYHIAPRALADIQIIRPSGDLLSR